ncbi:MAG: glycosyltransferase [Chitinophagaceae bacterium]|nr:glycosyltransferase [Chitinophagaceae bacterium]
MQINKILFLGASGKGALELSYLNAAKELGIEFKIFDPAKEEIKYIKGGSIGKKLHAFLPVEQWIRKMNREIILLVKKFNPGLVLLFTNTRVLPGTLACIRTMNPKVKIAWLWPDTPLNLEKHNFLNAPFVDMTCTYSSATLPVFERAGFPNIHWVPLAGDFQMHGIDNINETFDVDISFVGGWRPERERVMNIICEHFKNANIEIYGPYWKRDCKHAAVRSKIKGEGLYEKQLADFFNRSRINVNVIDDTNYPAANMRFFEVFTAGGLQLASACPEQENIFRHREHIVYFKSEEDIIPEIEWILSHKEECNQIRSKSHNLLKKDHTYTQRLKYITEHINFKESL